MHKISLLTGAAVVGALLVYVGGVYYTGAVVDEHLEKLPTYLQSDPNFKVSLEDYDLAYIPEENGFFNSHGVLQLTLKEDQNLKLNLKLDIVKKFLTAVINFDLPDFYAQLNKLDDDELFEGINTDTIRSSSYFKVHALPESYAFHYDLGGDYLLSAHRPLSVNLDVSIEDDQAFTSALVLRNVYTKDDEDQPFEIGQLDFKSEFTGLPLPRRMGSGYLNLDDLNVSGVSIEDLDFSYAAGELDKNGNFPLKLALELGKVDNKFDDVKLKLLLKNLNIHDLDELVGKDELTDEEQKKLLSTLREVKVDQFDFKLLADSLNLIKLLSGTKLGKSEVNVQFKGELDHDGSCTAEGLNGTFKLESEEDFTGGRLIADHERYKADIEVKAGKILVNGQELF
ncbi:MAG: YdgA family protein [Succinivibrio sp.]|nr:YdgA family protein [Succinivibrio sp.]